MTNVIFQINGGIGKCVAATAVCEAIHKNYPNDDLIVISGYPDVFLNNPNIYRTFNYGGMSYFYDDYIENKDIKIMAHDPYLETSFIKQDEHLIKIWCEMYGLLYDNEQPKIYLTARETKFFETKYTTDKPILLLQTNGGSQTEYKYSWARDIPRSTVIKVIDEFKKDFTILHIKREDQLSFDGALPISDNFRSLCVLISISQKRLFIDSFAQHTAAAMNKPSTVCWIANKPEVFGYQLHKNVLAKPFTKKPETKGSVLNKFNILGDFLEFAYNSEDEIFDSQEIIESLKSSDLVPSKSESVQITTQNN